MSFEIEIDVRGLEEAPRKIRSILSAVTSEDVENVLLQGARIVRDEAKRRAPVGPTGNLKRSLKAKKGKRRGKLFATAFAAVDRKIAPHAHLVEYGTGPRRQKTTGRYTGQMPAIPFFRPAVDATKDQVARTVNQGIARLIGRAVDS